MPATILVVDDNIDLRETMAELLSLEGFQTQTAANGKEALALLAANPNPNHDLPDVIVSDWHMPDMDGEALYRALRANAHYQNIPFILMGQFQSSTSMSHVMPDAKFLDKPFNPDEFISMVNALLQQGKG